MNVSDERRQAIEICDGCKAVGSGRVNACLGCIERGLALAWKIIRDLKADNRELREQLRVRENADAIDRE